MATGRAMAVEKVFLGWDRPAVVKVREHLLPQEIAGPVDLAKDLIVVPTRQAGRRLREALAVHCAGQKTALLSPRVVTPTFLLYPEDESGKLAGPLETTAVWTDVLTKADPSRYRGLFPARISSPDFTWAMRTAEMIQTLRDTLADGGYRISDVLRDRGHLLEEKDRWEDLAALETAYLERMAAFGLLDPGESMLRQAENPRLPKGTDRVVLAAVPDPTPLVIHVLERLSGQVPIMVLVHAPGSLADCFDGWGRPLAARWRERFIDVPDAEANIILAGSPASQSRKVLELWRQEAGRFGAADVALGVPDGGVIPFLAADLLVEGLVPFDPAGKFMVRHPLYQLLQSFQALVTEGTYQAFSAFLRQADFLDFLEEKHHLGSRRVLQELDEFQNEHLPQGLGDIERVLLAGSATGHNGFPNLAKAAASVMEWVRDFQGGSRGLTPTESNGQAGMDGTLRSLLEAVYESRILSPAEPGDIEFAAVAEAIDEAFRHLSGGSLENLAIDGNKGLELLLWALARQVYYPEPGDAVVDLEGWLELPWNDAPFLIVTGMNEGYVPRSRVSDIFLPDTLRRELGLQNDADWLSRDAYIMSALVESRRQGGRACFIAGKASGSGDVLKPSRLLFQCRDDELPRRAERLFSSAAEERINCPSSVTFPLEVTPPRDIPAGRLERTRISVTAFRDYLVCPFRFYLKHVLDMEELDDEKAELDARDFGSLVHDVLNQMADNSEMRRCENPARIQVFLCATAADWAVARFGVSPPLHIEIQLESARQRLREAAQVQARLVSEGWETIYSEREIEGQMEGLLVRGKVDRIDRHRKTGRIRVLDYKTSENAQSPDEVHLGPVPRDCELPEYMKVEVSGCQRRWLDLQLPLYSILLSADPNLSGPFELGYFNLPRALPDTGIEIWEGMSGSVLESADACARGVIGDIRRRRFWPPAGRVQYDDFARLFPAEAAACVNVETFECFIRGETK